MASLTKPEFMSMKSREIDSAMRTVLGQVFVNMPWSSIGQYFELVVENRMNVELGFSASDLESCSPGDVCDAVSKIRETGGRVSFHGPFWDMISGSIDPLIRKVCAQRFDSFFQLVERVLPERVVLHTGFDPRHHLGHLGQFIDNCFSTFDPFVRRAELLKCPLAIENVFEEGPQLHVELLERLNSSCLGFCLDCGHQHSFSRTPLEEWLQATWAYLKEVHLHDNDGSSDAHLPVGAGTVDFDYLFGFFVQKRIAPLLTVEPHTVDHLYDTLAGLAGLASFDHFLGACRKDSSSGKN
ncbi:MAG: sugar phosphate isomerase/epimerase [Syntrophobacteraceae bacterium]|nr:sugar phosphate isomerase/epimerase [Syntrophobacteraceae bacterium]